MDIKIIVARRPQETTRLIKGASSYMPIINLNNLMQCLCGITNTILQLIIAKIVNFEKASDNKSNQITSLIISSYRLLVYY